MNATATGAVSVTSLSGLAKLGFTGIDLLTSLPAMTSVAISGSLGTGSVSIGGSVIIDVFDLRTRAWIADRVKINALGTIPAGASAEVRATDVSDVRNGAGGVAGTTGSAAVGLGLIVSVINKDTRAYIGKSVTLRVGGNVNLSATGGFTYWGLAAQLTASTGAGVSGALIVAIFNQGSGDPGTRAYIDGGAATPTTVISGGELTVVASAPNSYELYAGNVAIGSSAGVGVSAVIFVNDGIVEASVASNDTLGAGAGGVTVSATQSEDMILLAVGGSVGGSAGVAGSVTVNVLTLSTKAHIDADVIVNSGGKVAVAASDITTLKGIAGAARDRRLRRRRPRRGRRGRQQAHRGVDRRAHATSTAGGDVTVDATSRRRCSRSRSARRRRRGGRRRQRRGFRHRRHHDGLHRRRRRSSTRDGSVRVAADEALKLDIIAGNFAGGGSAGVGAAASVPVVTKTTTAFIGDRASVTGRGFGAGLSVKSGAYR